jgi:signal transduction histidine kinase
VRTVRDLTSIFSARFFRQGVALEVECSESTPRLPLDASLMAQLLVNLLTNSLQATDRGGRVNVAVAPFPLRDGVILAVSDTGKGISAEDLERIFDPFFTTKEDGTGLGLAICRQIVEQHGGTITVESEPGKGTRVVALLPDLRGSESEEVDGVAAAG